MELAQFKQIASSKLHENERFFKKLKQQKPTNLDDTFNKLHHEVFKKTDCLACANCCKTTGPLFTQRDIKVLSKHLNMRTDDFIQKYLHIDEDNDYVLNVLPCPFLQTDNLCSVYDYRPNACREYPHTNQAKMHTIFKETLNNTLVCPAVLTIVERLKQHYK